MSLGYKKNKKLKIPNSWIFQKRQKKLESTKVNSSFQLIAKKIILIQTFRYSLNL